MSPRLNLFIWHITKMFIILQCVYLPTEFRSLPQVTCGIGQCHYYFCIRHVYSTFRICVNWTIDHNTLRKSLEVVCSRGHTSLEQTRSSLHGRKTENESLCFPLFSLVRLFSHFYDQRCVVPTSLVFPVCKSILLLNLLDIPFPTPTFGSCSITHYTGQFKIKSF